MACRSIAAYTSDPISFSWTPATQAQTDPAPTIVSVLSYFDGPKMVLALDERGRQLLGVAVDEDDEGGPGGSSHQHLQSAWSRLLKCRSGLRGLFESGQIEIYDIQTEWNAIRLWTVTPDEFPDELLPEPDAERPELSDDFPS